MANCKNCLPTEGTQEYWTQRMASCLNLAQVTPLNTLPQWKCSKTERKTNPSRAGDRGTGFRTLISEQMESLGINDSAGNIRTRPSSENFPGQFPHKKIPYRQCKRMLQEKKGRCPANRAEPFGGFKTGDSSTATVECLKNRLSRQQWNTQPVL